MFNKIEGEKQWISEFETKAKLIDSSYNSLMKKLKSIQDKLDEKVDSDTFDSEIAFLKAYVEAL